MRYVVRTYATGGGHERDRPDVETWSEDPDESAELFLQLVDLDPKARRADMKFRLLSCLLRGDRSFAVLSDSAYYKIERITP